MSSAHVLVVNTFTFLPCDNLISLRFPHSWKTDPINSAVIGAELEFYSYMQLLHAVLYKSPSALQQALTLVGIHSLSSNENRLSAPKEILLCDRSIFIPKIGFIFVSLPPGPKIKYRVSHFHKGLTLVLVLNCGGNSDKKILIFSEQCASLSLF